MDESYYKKDYIPMKKREIEKASKKFLREMKDFKGWGKKYKVYRREREQEYHDVCWDLYIDIFTELFIGHANDANDDGIGEVVVTFKDDGTLEYDFQYVEKAWVKLNDMIYTEYLRTHKHSTVPKEIILNDVHKEIEKRVPFLLNMFKEKSRSRHISAEVRYEVFKRDDGKCVVCGSNKNIEFDHVIPFSKGGSNSAENIRILCQECNRKRSNHIEKF